MYTVILAAHLGPPVALAVLGIYLLRKHPSVPAALVAIGFALVVAGGVAAMTESFEISRSVYANGSLVAAVGTMNHSGFQGLIAHYGQLFGLWIGTVGLVWQILGARATMADRLP